MISRRALLKSSLAASLVTLLPPGFLWADEYIQHPVMGGIPGIKPGQCPNCGMTIQVWGRTRHSFTLGDAQYTSCSIRCVADMARKAGLPAENVQVGLYLKPKTMIPANKAVYVIGSKAAGTMTMRSKLAFDSQEGANAFIKAHGGMSADYASALAAANGELDASYKKIEGKRLKKGKIVESDPESRCPVCNMYPARYPEHHSQVKLSDGSVAHFCSTQCLVAFKAEPAKYIKKQVKVKAAWVQVFPQGGWEYADGLYYLTGSSVLGPMGPEALPFRLRQDADKMADEKGGKVFRYTELTPEILNKR